MPSDDAEKRNAASRARTGGSARPVNPTGRPAPSSTRPGAPASPPSFAPAAGQSRPPAADDAVPVGRPARPAPPVAPSASRPPNPPRTTTPGWTAAPSAARSSAARPPVPTPTPPATPAGQPSATPRPPASRTASTPARPMSAVDGAPRARTRRRRAIVIAVVVLVALLAWPIGLAIWANGKLNHIDALSGAADTPGTTYLLAGSDARGDSAVPQDGTLGARTDTIMVLQVPSSGPVALISLPRDSYVDVPGHGHAKLNAAFSWGGAPLLVKTVEQLTGLTIDQDR